MGTEEDLIQLMKLNRKEIEHLLNLGILKTTEESCQSYHIGKSDYSRHVIQPWNIWKEYNLNPWDADIVKRVLRTKEGEARTLDYEKIIHICKYRIAELSKEVLKETKVVAPTEAEKPVEDERSDDTTVFCLDETMKPVEDEESEVTAPTEAVTPAEAEKPVEDEESDDTTVFCLDETMKPATFYIEGTKWGGKYVGYSVFMEGDVPRMYLGVDAEGNHLYADLSVRELCGCTTETHLPPRTIKLNYTDLFSNHRSSLKIGYEGKNYEKHDYIISCDGHLLRYFGMEGDMFYYRNMSARGADGTYPEFLNKVKLENKAIQFTL